MHQQDAYMGRRDMQWEAGDGGVAKCRLTKLVAAVYYAVEKYEAGRVAGGMHCSMSLEYSQSYQCVDVQHCEDQHLVQTTNISGEIGSLFKMSQSCGPTCLATSYGLSLNATNA